MTLSLTCLNLSQFLISSFYRHTVSRTLCSTSTSIETFSATFWKLEKNGKRGKYNRFVEDYNASKKRNYNKH